MTSVAGGQALPAHPNSERARGDIRSLGGRFGTASIRLARLMALRPGWLLALAIVTIYLASLSSRWYHTPDSALYQMLGRSLAAGEGYTLWGSPHAMVPPGYPLVIAALTKLGLGSVLCLNFCMLLMTLATLRLVYLVLAEAIGGETALLVAGVLAVSQQMHLAGLRLLSDVPFMLCLWLGLWCYSRALRGRSAAAWMATGTLPLLLGCAFRVAGALAVVGAAVGLAMLAKPRRRWQTLATASVLLGSTLVIALGCLFYAQAAAKGLPAYSGALAKLAGRSALDWMTLPAANMYATGENVSRLLIAQPMPLWIALPVCWLPIAVGWLQCAGLWIRSGTRRSSGWRAGSPVASASTNTLLAWVALAFVGGTLLARPMIPRYLIPVAPLLVLYYLEGCRWLAERIPPLRHEAQRVFVALAVVLACFNLPRVARAVYSLHYPQAARGHAETQAVEDAAAFIRANTLRSEKFISNRDQRRLAYLAGRASVHKSEGRLYHRAPTAAALQSWASQGAVLLVERETGHGAYAAALAAACRQQGCSLVFQNHLVRSYVLR